MKTQTTRSAAVDGAFYPKEYFEVIDQIYNLEEEAKAKSVPDKQIDYKNVSGLIVPHSGWNYSGKTASIAYQVLKVVSPSKIALIGPSHHYPINRIMADAHEKWSTPIGFVNIVSDNYFEKNSTYHSPEHALEVQMPFIKHYAPDAQVLPLMVGDIDNEELQSAAKHLLEYGYFLIVSTDLSHFETIETAEVLDAKSIDCIEQLDPSHVVACGHNPLKLCIAYCRLRKTKPRLMDYTTSAEVSGNLSRVVGYASFYF